MHDYDRDIAKKERKRDKKIAKIMKRSAISSGAGIGFLIMIPFLPFITDEEKMKEMKDLFSLTGMSVVGYGIFMTIAVFFMRNRALLLNGIMNWFIVPTYGIWFAFEAYKILSG